MGALHSTKQTVFTPLCLLTGFTITCSLPFNPPAIAQIIPDNSLGSESSVVVPNQNINGLDSDRIDGGAIRGSNLFHSFQEFNIDNGRGAYFSNPEAISNILTRVTGNNLSNILGTLGVLGNANLFLINPNGIVFGPNARLDVGGSFFATTADSVLFDNFDFSASNPEAPPLLTINIPIGLNFRENPGTIVNQSIAVDSEDNLVGLEVEPQKTLGLVGGDIQIEGGILTAPQGRIELGSVAGNSLVNLTPIDKGYALGYENVPNFQDIVLSQVAFVDVRGEGGGDIQIQGRRVTLTEDSIIEASTQGSEPGGIVNIKASESVEVISGGIFADIDPGATGTGGHLTINTQNLLVQNGSQISTGTFGNGDGGNLTVNATNVDLIGTSPDGEFPSGLFMQVNSGATGNGGVLTLETENLRISDGAQIRALTFGNGDGGDINVTAMNIELIGRSSGIKADVTPEATGNGGTISINTQNLRVQDGAQVSVSIFGNGDAGNLNVYASEVELIGTSTDGEVPSGLFAQINEEAVGNGGIITIDTENLRVQGDATISTGTFGNGDGGSVTITATNIELTDRSNLRSEVQSGAIGDGGSLTINTQRLLVQDGSQISTATFSNGNGGRLSITATNVEVVGTSVDGEAVSALGASVEPGATGNGGNLIINTQNLLVQNGAQIGTSTFGSGRGGDLTVTAADVQLIGDSILTAAVESEGTGNGGNLKVNTQRLLVRDSSLITASTAGNGNGGNLTITANDIGLIGSGGLFTQVNSAAMGNAGTLTINTQRLSVRDGAFVSTSTFGDGDAGNLTVTATDVELIGTSADGQFPSTLGSEATSESTGRAGTLTVNADNLTIRDGATIDVRSQSTEAAGDLIINAPNILLDNQATLNGETTAGEGNIILNTEDLRLRNNSNITTNATGEATGGNITINTETLTALEDSDISANAEDAFGGRITINAAGIFGTAFRTQQSRFSDITATSELGPEFSGTVELNTELDPSSGLIDLTQTVVDPSDLIAQEFCRQRGGSEFVVTGKGGIAADPNDKADGNQIEVDLVEPVPSRPRNPSQRRSETEDNQPISSLDIVPARGWIRDENGDVILVGYDPTKTGVQRQPSQLPQCQPGLNGENETRSRSVPSGETPIN